MSPGAVQRLPQGLVVGPSRSRSLVPADRRGDRQATARRAHQPGPLEAAVRGEPGGDAEWCLRATCRLGIRSLPGLERRAVRLDRWGLHETPGPPEESESRRLDAPIDCGDD